MTLSCLKTLLSRLKVASGRLKVTLSRLKTPLSRLKVAPGRLNVTLSRLKTPFFHRHPPVFRRHPPDFRLRKMPPKSLFKIIPPRRKIVKFGKLAFSGPEVSWGTCAGNSPARLHFSPPACFRRAFFRFKRISREIAIFRGCDNGFS